MTKPTWNVAIDLDNNNDFTDANENISSLVKAATWQLGFSERFEPIAKSENLTLVLDNSDKRFSPEYTSGTLYPNFTVGKPIRIQSTYSGSTFTHFLGWIDSIRPVPGSRLTRETTIECRGLLTLLQDSYVLSSASQNVTTNTAVCALFTAASVMPSWVGASIETGNSTLSVVGNEWTEDTTIYGALADVVGQEIGKLFISRGGSVVFWNRQHFISDTVSDASFNDTMVGIDYRFGEDIINSVIVKANVRTVASAADTLGTIDTSVKVPAGTKKTMSINFISGIYGGFMGGLGVVTPASNTDYVANSQSNGSGVDYTSSITASLVTEAGGRAEVSYLNNAGVDVWLQSGTQVRGQSITDYSQIEIKKEDATSISNYLRRRYTYPYPLDDVELAESAANYILARNKNPTGVVSTISVKPYTNASMLEQGLRRTIGDRITLNETQTALAKDYFIIGERFDLTPDDLLVTWQVEQADSNDYWVLGRTGFSELEVTTLLGPF